MSFDDYMAQQAAAKEALKENNSAFGQLSVKREVDDSAFKDAQMGGTWPSEVVLLCVVSLRCMLHDLTR